MPTLWCVIPLDQQTHVQFYHNTDSDHMVVTLSVYIDVVVVVVVVQVPVMV